MIFHIIKSTTVTAGVAVYAARLASAQAAAGHDVEVVCYWKNEYPLANGAKYRIVKSFRTFDANPDIVHIHAVLSWYMFRAMVWCRRKGVPYIVYPHGGLMPRVFTKGRIKKFIYWYLLLKPLMKTAKEIVCTSEDEVNACKKLGLPGPFRVALPCITLPESVPSFNERKKTILFLGRLGEEKGLVDLLAAWNTIPHNGWTLKLAGPDWKGNKRVLDKKIADDDIKDVVFTGEADGGMKDSLYREASLFVLPSPMENFSFAVLEALSYGVPVIASKGTPWGALVKYKCGWWVEPDASVIAEALRAAMSCDVSDLEVFSGNAREFVRSEFSHQ